METYTDQDYTPKSMYAELHLTYRCDLACINCNRICEAPPTTPDMTLDDEIYEILIEK